MTFLAGPDGFGLDAYSDDEKYAYSAKDFEEYGLPYQTDESGNAVLSLSNQERLEILVIRYKMKEVCPRDSCFRRQQQYNCIDCRE